MIEIARPLAELSHRLLSIDRRFNPEEDLDEAAMRRCAAVYALFSGELLR